MAWETRRRGAGRMARSAGNTSGPAHGQNELRRRYRQAQEQRRQLQCEVEQLDAKLADPTRLIEEVSDRTEVMLAARLLAKGFRSSRATSNSGNSDRSSGTD